SRIIAANSTAICGAENSGVRNRGGDGVAIVGLFGESMCGLTLVQYNSVISPERRMNVQSFYSLENKQRAGVCPNEALPWPQAKTYCNTCCNTCANRRLFDLENG